MWQTVNAPHSLLLAVVLGTGCSVTPPPPPPAPRDATPVAAPFPRTWDAVIDVFAERHIPIRTLDRSSGFIVTDQLGVAARDQAEAEKIKSWAHCGTVMGSQMWPDQALYNVVVRGDTVNSSVRVTVRWTITIKGPGGPTTHECTTTHAWESATEAAIKTRAERS